MGGGICSTLGQMQVVNSLEFVGLGCEMFMGSARVCVRAMVTVQVFGVAYAQSSHRCIAGSCRVANHH